MKTFHLRMIKRLTSLEEQSLDEFFIAEFMTKEGLPDLSISIYEVQDEEKVVVQTRTEHTASFRNPPTTHEAAVSLTGFPNVDVTEQPGGTRFDFTVKTHRTLNFINEEELRVAVCSVFEDLSARQRIAPHEGMRRYVCDRLEAKDEEWETLCADKQRKKWRPWALGVQGILPGITEDVRPPADRSE